MEDSKTPQFDSYLGGSQSVPSGVNLSDFIKSRMEEVVMLTETIKESPFRGQAFQRLPKHMRRRQMSHYIKRLPRRLQRPYLMSLKDGLPAPSKRPSRKYRRRPSNLLTDYNRRQKNSVWLETHIWHAKRFHMVNKWGYKLPEKPVNKSFRACYRAISEHCLLTDVSYYNCIELEGSQEILLKRLSQCTSKECGLSFGANMYLSGLREGSISLFEPNCYPYKFIGNVTFMWKPVINDETIRKIWIWVHPVTYCKTVECFKDVFDLTLERINPEEKLVNGKEEVKITQPVNQRKEKTREKKKKSIKIEQIKLEPKNVPFSKAPKYKNKDGSVVMSLLKDTLNRFQLTGPLSQAIISQAFQVSSVSSFKKKQPEVEVIELPRKKPKFDDVEILDDDEEAIVDKGSSNTEDCWWLQYYKNDSCKKSWEKQKDFYESLSLYSKPTDMASGIILSVVVEDPRLKIPSKRMKAVFEQKEHDQMVSNLSDLSLCESPIWYPEIRDKVSMTKLTIQEINEARSKIIVPGFDVCHIIPDEKQSRVPILLVQRPGLGESQFGKLGLGSGWDVIAPAGFGMPVWLSLIYRGARTGGSRESELIQLECGGLKNYIQPDSDAWEEVSQSTYKDLKNRYFKLPPNKRANFVKLGVLTPFYCPWNVLMKDWIGKTKTEIDPLEEKQKFCILRNEKHLKELGEVVGKFKKCKVDFDRFLSFGMNSLVPVVIECLGKGCPTNFSHICLPKKEDLKCFAESKTNPVEPIHIDSNEELRKKLRMKHKKLLKSLKRKRRNDRAKLKEDFARNLPGKLKWKDILKSDSAPSKTHSDEYISKMQSLWIPDVEKIESIMDSSSRKILGFVVKGGFSFSKSAGVALGYVTLLGLVELMKLCQKNKSRLLALVRNGNHVQYRFVKLRIATN